MIETQHALPISKQPRSSIARGGQRTNLFFFLPPDALVLLPAALASTLRTTHSVSATSRSLLHSDEARVAKISFRSMDISDAVCHLCHHGLPSTSARRIFWLRQKTVLVSLHLNSGLSWDQVDRVSTSTAERRHCEVNLVTPSQRIASLDIYARTSILYLLYPGGR